MTLNDRELATVLAALRYWQREGWRSSGAEIDIATDSGKYDEPLDSDAIDSLIDALQWGKKSAARDLLRQAVSDWPQVFTDEAIPGTEAVDWLGRFVRRAKDIVG